MICLISLLIFEDIFAEVKNKFQHYLPHMKNLEDKTL